MNERLRRQVWRRAKDRCEYCWDGPVLVGRAAIGRATVELLKINHPNYVEVRAALIHEGVFPPES